MSRVDSVRIAIEKARDARGDDAAELLAGSVVASDAFFPFPDGPLLAIDAGATALIQPGGSVRDAEVIAACDEAGRGDGVHRPPALSPLRLGGGNAPSCTCFASSAARPDGRQSAGRVPRRERGPRRPPPGHRRRARLRRDGVRRRRRRAARSGSTRPPWRSRSPGIRWWGRPGCWPASAARWRRCARRPAGSRSQRGARADLRRGSSGVGARRGSSCSSSSPDEVEALDGLPTAGTRSRVWAWIDEAAGVIRERVFAAPLRDPGGRGHRLRRRRARGPAGTHAGHPPGSRLGILAEPLAGRDGRDRRAGGARRRAGVRGLGRTVADGRDDQPVTPPTPSSICIHVGHVSLDGGRRTDSSITTLAEDDCEASRARRGSRQAPPRSPHGSWHRRARTSEPRRDTLPATFPLPSSERSSSGRDRHGENGG